VQKRRHSLLEACISTAIGFGIAFTTNAFVMPAFGFHITTAQNFWITVIFTFISVVRGYYVRRLFNFMHVREWL
jgi:hypothetical protein